MFPEGFPFKARAALLLAALIAVSLTAFGQTSSGEVNGAIVDQTGAGISAATVKLTNQTTGIETQTPLNNEGRFTFVNVNYDAPSALTINSNATQIAPNVGRITGLAPGTTPRQMQFGLRLAF